MIEALLDRSHYLVLVAVAVAVAGAMRDECLNVHWFESVRDAAASIEAGRRDYDESRPHMALGDLSPAEFARGLGARAPSSGSMGVGN